MGAAFDAASSSGFEGLSSVSWTHTPVGTPNCVFVTVSWTGYPTNPSTVSGVTYGGQSMTSIGSATSNGFQGAGKEGKVETFRLTNPPSGAQTVAVTFSGGSYGRAGATTWTGADTTTPNGSVTSANNGSQSTAPTVTLASTTSGRIAYGAFVSDYSTSSIVAGLTQAWAGTSGPGAYGGGAEYASSTGSSMAMGWTVNSAANYWAAMAFEIIPTSSPSNSVAPSCSPASGGPVTSFTFSSGTWTGSPTGWSWEYQSASGGSWTQFSTLQNPTVTGSTFGAGTWNTRLTATNAGGSATANGTQITVAAAQSASRSLTLTGVG